MATITEVAVRLTLSLAERADGLRVVVNAISVDALGNTVRSASFDITERLSATQRAAASNFMSLVEAKVKEEWGIS